MSYWTYTEGMFPISSNLNLELINKAFQSVEGTDKFKLTGNVRAEDFISAIHAYCTEEADETNEDFHQTIINHAHLQFRHINSFVFANADGVTHKVRIPCIPHPPIGSEGGLGFNISFNDKWFFHNVIMSGSLRDYDDDLAPYVEWWYKTVSALLNHRATFMYEVTYEKPVAKSFDFWLHEEERLETIKEYFAIMFAWYKKCEDFLQKEEELFFSEEYKNADFGTKEEMFFHFTDEHQPDFQSFVINCLEGKKQNND